MKLAASGLNAIKLSLLVAFFSVIAACSSKNDGAKQAAPVPVRAVVVERKTVPLEIVSVGSVAPVASVKIRPRVGGEIVKVHFRDGASVAAGDLLFSLDPRPYQIALKKAEALLVEARASGSLAVAQVGRYSALARDGVVSKEQLLAYSTGADTGEALVDARLSEKEEALLRLAWCEVRAPISGRIGVALLTEGNLVQADSSELAVIHQIAPILVEFSLPEGQVAPVRELASHSRLKVMASEPDSGAVIAEGELFFVGHEVDRVTGTVLCRAQMENQDEKLWPGAFVDVVLRLREEEGVLTLPVTALMETQGGYRVYVVEKGVANLRDVQVSRIHEETAVIVSGVQEGETVISFGQLRVAPGASVKIQESSPTPKGS